MPADPSAVETAFHAALAAAPAERPAILAGLPADVREHVERLLAAHADLDGPNRTDLHSPTPERTDAHLPRADAGTVVAGRYKLLQQIGEGGMGTVWMADQTEPVKRRVAVKLIRTDRGNSQTILARFAAERQAIAVMDHPHIAKLLDAGTWEVVSDQWPVARTNRDSEFAPATDHRPLATVPFFVMELVKGVPLTDYCDQHRLSVPDRLTLFMQICSAVQHAHQKGVIHRDLKPSNVLVESHDGKPVPKVIDFGLAKATSGLQLTEHTLFTGFGTVLGTPLYMAPEQAAFNATDIDTRADVYALGVILYELLTGTTPLTRESIKKAALDVMLKLIREQEAPTPSSRLSSSESKPTVAANRQMEPAKLGRFVKGELDWIVMKALSKERDRRYETANGFARDVERFLNHEPVLAGPVGAGYRMRKFVQRNRLQVIAAGLVLLTLIGGAIGTTVGLFEAKRQAAAAVKAREDADAKRIEAEAAQQAEADERKKAVEKEREATATLKFFEKNVFVAARPKSQPGGLGKDVTLRAAITASLPALANGFRDQPLVEARLRHTLGITFADLGEIKAAVEQFERERAIFTEQHGTDHPATLGSIVNLAIMYSMLGRYPDALELFEQVIAVRRREFPPEDPITLKTMANLANTYDYLGRLDDALKMREETLAARRRVLPPDDADTLTSMAGLAISYSRRGRHADAAKLLEDAMAAQRRVLPPDHTNTLVSMANLAICYEALGRRDDALKMREEVLAAQRRVLPPDHPLTLEDMTNLANSYSELGRRDEALKLREEVLAAQRRVLPPDHPHTLVSMNNLAISYGDFGRHADALKLYEQTLAARRRVLPPDDPDTLLTMVGVAESLADLNRSAEAIPVIDEFLSRVAAGKDVPADTIPALMEIRLLHSQQLGDLAGCRASNAMWEKLNRSDADSLYAAGMFRAMTAAAFAKAKQPAEATADADRAMAWLTKAVAAGFQNRLVLETDANLTVLRDRADFQKLLASLPKLHERAPPPRPVR